MRRVIKQDRELPGLGFRIPHRKSYVISGERLRPFIEPEELSLPGVQYIPETVILISEPKESELEGMSRDDLFRWTWRLLFHARVHLELEGQIRNDQLSNADIRARIDRIGQVEFDEARAVLQSEHFLIGHPDAGHVYTEFAALFLEYLYFSPWRLKWYFPSLTDPHRIEQIIQQDFDSCGLLEKTRLGNLESPFVEQTDSQARVADSESQNVHADAVKTSWLEEAEKAEAISEEQFSDILARERSTRLQKLAQKARVASDRGNTVRAATLFLRASRHGADETASVLRAESGNQLNRLVSRLKAALDLSDTEAVQWRSVLLELLTNSTRGFWNPDRRLLYDLQKVCLDHEREVFRVDLLAPLRTLGQRPIQRPLPFQREVLMVKHLRRALHRLRSVSMKEVERERLSRFLHRAVGNAESNMRTRLRPVLQTALNQAGFQPTNIPEIVASEKLVEELLDAVVKRGYLTMGVLRDCISRNQLKLPNLGNPLKLITGDRLLKADRQLAGDLDGVYRRGEFYLRWLQRISSLGFGTILGRLLTLYLFLPFGGAYMALSFTEHLVHKIGIPAHGMTDLAPLIVTGIFILGLMHWPKFRQVVSIGLTHFVRILGSILIDMPAWAIHNPSLRRFLRSPRVVFVRRFVVTPLLFTIMFCFALPKLGVYRPASLPGAVIVYFAFTAVLNTKLGRDVEEITADWIDQTWYQLRTRFFMALFEFIMWAFKTLLELFERFLYAIDEWLRFKSGESRPMFWIKAVAGMIWAGVSFVMMFFITLLAEPQINPVKHFPVVTVSHKIILPLGFPGGFLSQTILPLAGTMERANAIAGTVVFLIPGIFGFLVWELRSNWRLYAANRPKNLSPVLVGSHGESMIRLMKPGFHSGTLPKLFAKMRRAGRREESLREEAIPAKYREALHHIEESIRQFVDREFLGILRKSNALPNRSLSISVVWPSSNSICVELICENSGLQSQRKPSHTDSLEDSLEIVFQEQSGWLLAGIRQAGWLSQLNEQELDRIATALAGLFHLSGVDMVREQIQKAFGQSDLRYDVDDRDLVVWPDETYETEWRFDLDSRPELIGVADPPEHVVSVNNLQTSQVLFVEQSLPWKNWVAYWNAVAQEDQVPEVAKIGPRTLIPDFQ